MDRILKRRLEQLEETYDFATERKALLDAEMIDTRGQPLGSVIRKLNVDILRRWAPLAEKKIEMSIKIVEIQRKVIGR